MTGNFRNKTNLDWWEKLEAAAKKHQIKWEWIKGHAGHEVQEVADKAARNIAAAGHVEKGMLDELVAEIGILEL